MDKGAMHKLFETEYATILSKSENNSTFLKSFAVTSGTLGIALSASALIFLVLTAVLFQEWRQNHKNQLLIQFMLARFFYTVRRYLSNVLYFSETIFVQIKALTVIYTELVLVFWMLVFSKQMYDSFVKVFKDDNPNLCAVTLSTWLIPAVLTLLLYLSFYMNGDIYDRRLLACLIVLKWPVLCANGILLVLILKSILRLNLSNTESNKRIVIVIIVLIFSFCIQQVVVDVYRLTYNSDNKTEYVIVFSNILSMYHCATSILFWVFGNSKTRTLWKIHCYSS